MKAEIVESFQTIGERVVPWLTNRQRSLAGLQIHYKNQRELKGVVSEADYTAEAMILDDLHQRYPDIPILSEERAHQQGVTDYGPYRQMPRCFAIDPLDGSHNFVRGLDHYCVSMAFLEWGQPRVGFVVRPATGESFAAVAGAGAWCQKAGVRERLWVEPQTKPLKSCLLGVGLSWRQLQPIAGRVSATRRMGSAALDLCYVAAGRFDGYCAQGLSPWDVAGAAIILQEANIETSNFQGQPMDCFGRTFVAAPQGIYPELQEIL